MPDTSRVAAGFRTLARGMDGGKAPSLIGTDQVALAINMTFRGAYMRTRPPYANHMFSFYDDATQTNWTGKFQGWAYYDGEAGQSGWMIARGGRLFFLTSDTWVLRDVTPFVLVSTVEDFIVPIGGLINIRLNTTVGIPNGIGVLINGGLYSTNSPGSNPVPFVYFGGDTPGNTVPAGTSVLDQSGNPIKGEFPFPASKDFIFMFQAENYMIVLGGQHKTVIWNGTTARQAGIGEIPVGEIGAYGWGRIWISRPGGRTYEGGNLAYGTTLSRSDILGWDENDFLNEGGSFAVPYNAGPITSMSFLATQDTSLGQGPLIIGTPNMVFSNQAPVDRTVWKNLRNPIQTIALLESGPEGGRCFVQIDGDIWYRSLDGIRSFIVARRSFGIPGNVPLSRELADVLKYDDGAMLRFGAGLYFDNRFLCTTGPMRTDLGIIHKGLAVVNFDLLSSMGQKSPSAWEGIWTGLDVLALSKARISGIERAYAIVAGCDDIEFWELKKDGVDDQYTSNPETIPTETVIEPLTDDCTGETEFTLTATVTSDSGVPTGNVTFRDDGDLLGTVPLVAGVAELEVTLATGQHDFTATYEGTAVYSESTSDAESFNLLSALNCEWLSRIQAAGGARPSDNTFEANDVFYAALVSAGVWSKIVVMNTYAPDNLIAAITPLKQGDGFASWTNSGPFVGGDLTVNGLKGNGSSQYLRSNSSPLVSGMTTSSSHGCVYVHTDDRTSAQTEYGSATGPNTSFRNYYHYNDNKTYFSNCIMYDAGTILGTSDKPGFLLQSRTATNRLDAYFANSTNPHAAVYTNTVPLGGGDGLSSLGLYVHSTNENGSPTGLSKKRNSFVCWGTALTSGESLALYNAVQALRTSYGGGFV